MNFRKTSGKKSITVQSDKWGGVEVSTCRNGYHVTQIYLDTEMLTMLRDSINEYLLSKTYEEI